MVNIYALNAEPLPAALYGTDAGCSVRPLSDGERLAIEDNFFRAGEKLTVRAGATAVVIPQTQAPNTPLEDHAVFVEFALGILTVSGFQAVSIMAKLDGTHCAEAVRRSAMVPDAAVFPRKLVKTATSTWIRHVMSAR